jgi:peptidoglycan/LPS O-acetylase OafA/YrhL
MNSNTVKKIHIYTAVVLVIYYASFLLITSLGYRVKENTIIELLLTPVWFWLLSYFTSKVKDYYWIAAETLTWICFTTCLIIFGDEDWSFFDFGDEIVMLFIITLVAMTCIVMKKLRDWGEI